MMRTDARHGGLLLCSFKLRRRRPSYIYRKPINPACIFLLALRVRFFSCASLRAPGWKVPSGGEGLLTVRTRWLRRLLCAGLLWATLLVALFRRQLGVRPVLSDVRRCTPRCRRGWRWWRWPHWRACAPCGSHPRRCLRRGGPSWPSARVFPYPSHTLSATLVQSEGCRASRATASTPRPQSTIGSPALPC